MVQKLNLKIVSHSHPYKLCWLQSDNEIKVRKRYLVSFSLVEIIKMLFGVMLL